MMRKIEVLTQITENTKLMEAIEAYMSLNAETGFYHHVVTEYYELREENGTLANEYMNYGLSKGERI